MQTKPMMFELPAPHRVLNLTLDDGAVSYIRQHGNTDSPVRLVLSHGNGFAIDGYLPFWSGFLDCFEVVLCDCRNHGWNAPSDPANHHYPQLVRDLELRVHGVTEQFGCKTSVGAFHSLSGADHL
jgi:pimeloyl-ACP methyl ester carboxylesterase